MAMKAELAKLEAAYDAANAAWNADLRACIDDGRDPDPALANACNAKWLAYDTYIAALKSAVKEESDAST